MQPKVIQNLMGHQHYSTTIDIYTHVTNEKFDEEIEKFGAVLENVEQDNIKGIEDEGNNLECDDPQQRTMYI